MPRRRQHADRDGPNQFMEQKRTEESLLHTDRRQCWRERDLEAEIADLPAQHCVVRDMAADHIKAANRR
jgi:hypothetical protein